MKIGEAIRILGETNLCTPLGQAAFVAIEALKKQDADNWISVEERLPTIDERYGDIEVLVHMDDGFIATTIYDHKGFQLWAESGEVTHWQPLPEPPKVKGE